MTYETGYYDSHGIPIYVGDLIRVKHYRHYRNRRQMWLYFRVACHPMGTSKYVACNWSDLNSQNWQCLLADAVSDGDSEVIAECGLQRNARGEIMTFNERTRLKKVEIVK